MTADPLTRAAAIVAHLDADDRLMVYDNEEVKSPPDGAYVIFTDGADHAFSDRLSGEVSQYEFPFYLICAGGDVETMRWCVNRVRRRMIGLWIDGSPVIEDRDFEAPEITDTTIPADVRNSRTLAYRHNTNWS